MSDDPNTTSPLSRRELLALFGSASAIGAGGLAYAAFDDEQPPADDEEPPDDGTPEESTPSEPQLSPAKRNAENIREHGARPNPSDSSIEAAERNLDALQTAAESAGPGGAVYVPEGTYYFGRQTAGYEPFNRIGEGGDMPAGTSIYGDGPERSTLAVSARTDGDANPVQTGFHYNEGVDHGRVTIADIRLDGNAEELPNLRAAGGGSRCLNLDGEGDAHMSNVHVRGWYQEAILGHDVLRTVDRCTFEDNAIADHNYSNGQHIGHHITTHASEGNPLTVRRSRFIDCSGSAIDVRYNTGEIHMRDCYVTGTGANLCKLSASALFDVRRVYHRANTTSLESKLDELDGKDFDGRQFIQRIHSRTDSTPTVHLENVLSTDMTDYALQCRVDQITIEGDMVAIRNANMRSDNEVIRDRKSGRFTDVDIDRLSVHGCAGQVFDLSASNGRVGTLARGGNQGGLGSVGDVTIETDRQGSDPLVPATPLAAAVGINTGPQAGGNDEN